MSYTANSAANTANIPIYTDLPTVSSSTSPSPLTYPFATSSLATSTINTLTVATTTQHTVYTPFSGYSYDTRGIVTTYLTLNGKLVGTYSYEESNPSNAKLTYVLTNYLGTPALQTDEHGDIVEMDITDVFGNYVARDQRNDSAEHVKAYTGHEFDDVTGLTYAKARYLDTKAHSFLSVDPLNYSLPKTYLLDPQQLNTYAYARNNPIIYTDPDGKSVQTYFEGAGDQLWQDAPYLLGGAVVGTGLVAAGIISAPVLLAVGAGLSIYGAGSLAYNGYQTYQAYNSGSINADMRDYYAGRLSVGAAELGIGGASLAKGVKSGSSVETTSFSRNGYTVNVRNDITEPYSRPSNATTQAQRDSVQGKSCVTCGAKAPTMVADHKTPLMIEYYQTGTINQQRMTSVSSVQPQCPTCSAQQGGILSSVSKQIKSFLNIFKK